MAHIVIATYGSRGDLLPLTDIGRRLVESGHDVVMTATPDLAADVAAGSLDVVTVDFELEDADTLVAENPLKAARQMVLPSGMRQLGGNLLDALDDVPADLMLLSPFAELAGHPLAEARGVPTMGVRLQPISTTSEFPPSLIGGWSAGSVVNRAAGRLAAAAVDRIYASTVAGFRDRLGLPARSARSMRRRRTDDEWPILHGFSPNVLPRPDDWRPGLEVTGYWWPRRGADWEPPAELVSFLGSGAPPVFFGLGSLMMSPSDAADMSDMVREAFTRLGVRGVIQSGGAGLDVIGDDFITVDAVPHDWLFGRVAAVVHSCGAGTMAAGLRAGLPAVAVPSPGGDQPFWAGRLADLGVCPAPLSRPRLSADRLARAVDAALTDPSTVMPPANWQTGSATRTGPVTWCRPSRSSSADQTSSPSLRRREHHHRVVPSHPQ